MPRKPINDRFCPNANCALDGQLCQGNIVRHGFIRLKRAKRRRYRCTACRKTFCSTTGTPHYRLHCTRKTFEEVACMSANGISKAAIARIRGVSWNTVARWLERAADAARTFHDVVMQGYTIRELQADEIRTFVPAKNQPLWVSTAIEVWSRLWTSTVLGRRSYKNARRLMRDTALRGRFERPPLISTDGFQYYLPVIARLFGPACVYAQVMKTWRNNRVIKVERRLRIGSRRQLANALSRSEDSAKLNTSFIERLNLTIRQGSAYLSRRSPCHARSREHLDDHLELLRCYYNFVRPHMALKFGRQMLTPAMQAGLVSKRLTFREIFTAVATLFLCVVILMFCESSQTEDGVLTCAA